MGNYTRANIQLNPAPEPSAEAEILAWLREELFVWDSIHVIPLPQHNRLELRFTTKARTYAHMGSLADRGYEVWAITNVEACGVDVIGFYAPKSKAERETMPHPHFPDYGSKAIYAFDEIYIATKQPENLIPQLRDDCQFKIKPTGIVIEERGLYNAENFLYYGNEFSEKHFDSAYQHDLVQTHSVNGCITDLVMCKQIPFIDNFLETANDSWGKPNQHPNIDRLEFRHRGQTTHLFFYDTDSFSKPLWEHYGHDGFSNCVDTRYVESLSKKPNESP